MSCAEALEDCSKFAARTRGRVDCSRQDTVLLTDGRQILVPTARVAAAPFLSVRKSSSLEDSCLNRVCEKPT